MTAQPKRDLTQTVLAIIFIGILIGSSVLILRPFLGAFVWATMIVVATWPLMRRVEARCYGRRWLAVTFMTIVLLLVFILPLWMVVRTAADKSGTVVDWFRDARASSFAHPPQWMRDVPWAGAKIAARWEQAASSGLDTVFSQVRPYVGTTARWIAVKAGGVGTLFLHLLLTIILSAILYYRGEEAAHAVRSFARRLAGSNGDHAAVLAAQAIRAVALGVMVTALAQSLLSGIGLAIAGVPNAFLLTTLCFILAVIQIGAVPVMLATTIWVYWQGETGWGTFLLVWTIITGTIDNFLRPVLIKRGANLPLLLIFAGVIGGLFAFGAIGLFVGPVVLAVTYVLLVAWVTGEDAQKITGTAPRDEDAGKTALPPGPAGAAISEGGP